MAWLHLREVAALVAVGVCSCAASNPAPAQSPATTVPPPETTIPALTSAEVTAPSPIAPELPAASVSPTLPPARWSDGDIVAALRAADAGRDDDAKAARTRSKSVRVDRFAEDVLQQERELLRDESGLMLSLGATKSPLEERVMEARHSADVAAIDAHGADFDRDFMAGEIRYEHQLMRLIDDEMIPNARSPELHRFLQSLRATIEKRLIAAEEVSSNLL
jgi:predicted outer membrane protein